jgi:hypothetical protein
MFDRLNMTLRRVVKSGNVVRLTPITRIGSNIRGSIESTLATDAAGAREKVRQKSLGVRKRILMDSGG